MAEIKLYPHNQETYNRIQEMWKTTNRVAAIQATGTGKSFLILKCLFDLPNENKVVLAPTEYIFGQLIEHSDEVIPNVQFITYSKMANMTDEEIEVLNPSLIVFDEFHRCGAEQWGKGVQNLLNSFPNVKVLGTSATPIRYLDNERDMSDELFEGNVAVNLSLAEAIVKGILPMPKYISALYTFEDETNNLRDKVIKSHNSDEEKEKLLKQIDLMKNKLDKSKGIPNILKKHLGQSNGKFIVFCKNKEHLNEMKIVVTDWFRKANINSKIETYTVYTGYENTDTEFELFRDNKNENTLKLLFSIEMLNEGVHVEDIDGVMLLRTTISPIIYYQQIGRGIDAGSNKKPIIFDFVNNFDNIKTNSLVKDLKEARQREIYARKEYENNENTDIPEFIVYDEILEVKELFNSIEDNIHGRGDWGKWYGLLEQFFNNFGHCNVSNSDNPKLLQWVKHQRNMYFNNQLSQYKIEKLKRINFIWNIHDILWNEQFMKLVNSSNNVYDKDLKNWVHTQRRLFKQGILEDYKIKKLQKIDFIFDPLEEKWNYMFNLLKEYKNEYGHCNLKGTEKYKNESLGRWAAHQRSYLSKLSEEKINKLSSLNFSWNILESSWESMYLLLVEFVKEFGHCKVEYYFIYKNEKLGQWVAEQRKSFKKHKLNDYRIDKLNKLNFVWQIKINMK